MRVAPRIKFAVLGLSVVTFVIATGGTARAGTLDQDAQGCQAALGKASLGLMKAYTGAFKTYLAAETKAPNSGDVAKRDGALAKADSKFDDATAKKCDPTVLGFDVVNTAPPAGIGFATGTCGALWGERAPEEAYEQGCAALPSGTFAQKQACWKCFLKGELREWLKGHSPWVEGLIPNGSDLCGTPPIVVLPPPDKPTAKCLSAAAKNADALLVGTVKNTTACLNDIRKGKGSGPCPDAAKGIPAIEKLKGKVIDGNDGACVFLPAWWDGCFETANPTCPGALISSVWDMSACTNSASGLVADEIVCAFYPGAVADGVACEPDPTPTPTPTPTSPTPTATWVPPPTCGNGANDPGEKCDASASTAGWASCGPDFTCVGCNCACPTKISFTGDASSPDSTLDTGWTGISHRNPIVTDGTATITMNCGVGSVRPCGACPVSGPVANGPGQIDSQRCNNDTSIHCTTNTPCTAGGGTCQFFFGSNLPLAAGGVTVCAVNQFNGSISGTANVETGDAVTVANLTSRVYTGISIDTPCARCVGDTTINDGVKNGTCDGGTRGGLTCDGNGTVFNRPDFGTTSLDCPLAAGALIATLPIDLSNATAPVTKTLDANSPRCRGGVAGERCLCDTCDNAAATPCDSNADCPAAGICGGKRCMPGSTTPGLPCTITGAGDPVCGAGLCNRPGKPTAPSACLDDTATPGIECLQVGTSGEGACALGPTGSTCSVASGHAQRGCSSAADCGGGAGSCGSANRDCFLTGGGLVTGTTLGTGTLIAVGMADVPMGDTSNPTLGAVFCVGPTGASAVNDVSGLPGPGRTTIKGAAIGRP